MNSHVFIFRRQTIQFGQTLTALVFTFSTASTPVSNELIYCRYIFKNPALETPYPVFDAQYPGCTALPLTIIISLTAQSCPDLPIWLLGRICVHKEPCNTMVILKQTQGHALSLTNQFLSLCHQSHDWFHIATRQDLEVTYMLWKMIFFLEKILLFGNCHFKKL